MWLLTLLAVLSLPVHSRMALAANEDHVINSGSIAVKYRPVGTTNWTLLQPGQTLVVTQKMEFLNESFSTAQLTTQRNIDTGYTTVFVIVLSPGAQGTYDRVGTVCTNGQWTVTTYYYSGQYIGNIYGRTFLSPLGPGGVNPVITVWGYEAYAGGSRIEATVFDNLRTSGHLRLVGSSDATCSNGEYTIDLQGEYINWNNNGMVTTRTMPCAVTQSLPALSPAMLVALLALLGGTALLVQRRRLAA
jgi:hypothetical protein